MRSLLLPILALCVGLLLSHAGQGSGPAPIETLDPVFRQPALDLLMLLMVGAGLLAARATGRYWKAGDPRPGQIYYVDEHTGQSWRGDAPRPRAQSTAYTGDTERL